MLDTTLPTLLDSDSETEAATPNHFAAGPVFVRPSVNDVAYDLTVEPHVTLVEALRDRLDLTGTKLDCDRDACSACTVWLDGAPDASCMLLTIDVGDRKITTIEALAQDDALHPAQAASIDDDAMQCGFCTPGIVMSFAALSEANPNPSVEDVQHAISGRVCRCGSRPHVISATLAADRGRKA